MLEILEKFSIVKYLVVPIEVQNFNSVKKFKRTCF